MPNIQQIEIVLTPTLTFSSEKEMKKEKSQYKAVQEELKDELFTHLKLGKNILREWSNSKIYGYILEEFCF